MADTDVFPPVPEIMVQALERLFPDKSPELTSSNRQVWYDAGAVSVVRFLRHCYEEQQKQGTPQVGGQSTSAHLSDLGLFSLSPIDKEW